MIVTVLKRGDGLWFKIPYKVVEEYGIFENMRLVLKAYYGTIHLKPKLYELSELLEGINESNLHGEIFPYRSVGNEIW